MATFEASRRNSDNTGKLWVVMGLGNKDGEKYENGQCEDIFAQRKQVYPLLPTSGNMSESW